MYVFIRLIISSSEFKILKPDQEKSDFTLSETIKKNKRQKNLICMKVFNPEFEQCLSR